MEKPSLKLKLKIGGPATPESDHSPKTRPNSTDPQDMAEEEPALGSEEEVEEEEWAEDGQNENGGDDDGLTSRTRHSHHEDNTREKHKKSKKKKKKREREKEKERHKHRHHRDKTDGEDDVEPPAKKLIKSEGEEAIPVAAGTQSTVTEVLQYLLDQLMKKDPQQFFAHPVTDAIAPGYSSIITQPMDFSRIQLKINNNEYTSIPELTSDVKLMCNNCMTYNQQDTVYFKSAKKLFHIGEKMLAKEKLLTMRKELPAIATLSKDQLGFEFPPESANGIAEAGEEIVTDETLLVIKDETVPPVDTVSKFEAIPDDMTPEEITEQANTASQEAAEKLTQKKAECTLGFLRQREDGTTSLNFLIGCEGSDPNLKEKPVSLGFKTGKLTQGSATLHNYREDKRNMAKPVKPLSYGAYSSFCPSYDSTFANLTKEESEMVYATYGNDTAVQYAESIMDFSRNCDTATYLVDQLLNLLTHQQHSRTQATIEERRKLQEEEDKINSLITTKQESSTENEPKSDARKEEFDFASLRGLSQLGIDTSFLNYFESLEQKSKNIKMQLEENAQLLEDLSKTQKERLSKPLPQNLNILPQPSNTELQLVEKVTEGLTNIARQVPPGSLAPVPIVRRALGITMVPVPSDSPETA